MFRLLLVDDEDAILRLLTAILEVRDIAVTTASSAREAVALLGAKEFEVVLTDLRMETALAGYDVARAASQLTPRPLILLLTASSPAAKDWQSTGADALLEKGTGALEIPETIEGLLQGREYPAASVA